MKTQDLANEIMAILTLVGSIDKAKGLLAATLRKEHFKDPRTLEIYTRIMAMAKQRKELPGWETMQHDTLLSAEARELLDEKTYPSAKTKGDAEQILDALEKMRQSRVIILTYDQVIDVMQEEKADPLDAFSLMEKGLLEARTDQTDETLSVSMGGNFLAAVAALLKRKKPNTIPTGFHDFDSTTGGLPRGGLTTLAATSGGGKSCMGVQLCVNAFKAGYSAAIVTLEMSKTDTTGRIASNISGVDYTAIYLSKLNKMQKQRIAKASKEFQQEAEENNKRLEIYHRTDMTFTEIALEMRAMSYDLIIVDYINLLNKEPSGSNNNDASLLGDIARAAKVQAGATNTAWVVLAQMNENGDVKYARAIREHSDCMLTWSYGDAEKESHMVEINIKKSRHSSTAKFILKENFKNQRFENIGGPNTNADVAIRKNNRTSLSNHPTAKPMFVVNGDEDEDL